MLTDYDFSRADDLMNSLRRLVEKKSPDQGLEESIFKFRLDWMFLERRIKTFQKSAKSTEGELLERKANESEEKYQARKRRMMYVFSQLPDEVMWVWGEKNTEEKRKILDEHQKVLVKRKENS